MKRKNWICLASAAVLTAALLPLPKQFLSADSAKSDDIVILYTNDVHCAVDTNIGYAGLALYQRELEAQYEHVFTVDAGDAIQGAPVGSATKGKDIITLMNAVGYDVCIPGNHEFDYGMDCLLERSKELTCGYISCNLRDTEQDKTLFAPYQILEAGDKRIAFVGVTTPVTFMSSTPVIFQNEDGEYIYSFYEQEGALIPCIQDSVDAARKENPDYVILLGHLGENGVKPQWSTPEVVSQLKGVDAVIDGHSHEEISAQKVRDADGKTVIITQTGTKLKNIGKLTISGDGTIHTELIDAVPEPDKKLNLPEDSWGKKVRQLSIGQQQRVAAARALIGRPELIVADEPTSALDYDRRISFLDVLMKQCRQQNTTLLFVSHDLNLAPQFSRTVDLNEINHAGYHG